MQTIQTAELTGAALDWAVAKCEEVQVSPCRASSVYLWLPFDARTSSKSIYRPSADWEQGGPIIEREAITVSKDGMKWLAMAAGGGLMDWGATYLQAAMRCYVASKLGDTVEVPDELLNQ